MRRFSLEIQRLVARIHGKRKNIQISLLLGGGASDRGGGD